MKRYTLILCLVALLTIPGCSKAKELSLAYVNIDYSESLAYSISLVCTKVNSSSMTANTVYTGDFDLVVNDKNGLEISRIVLNEVFNESSLTIDAPITIFADDYNNDGLYDIPIGFSDGETGEESKYAMFSIDKDGKISMLKVNGYKDDGFIYTVKGSVSSQFTKMIGTGQGKPPGLLVGVTQEKGGYAPAQYIWQGTQFIFHKNTPYVIAEEKISLQGTEFTVLLIQAAYAKAITTDDKNFCIYESMYKGFFDIVVLNDSEHEVSRLKHEEIFGNEPIGFGGSPVFVFRDYIGNGVRNFMVGCHAEHRHTNFQYAIINIDDNGQLSKLPCAGYGESGYAYSVSDETNFKLLEGDEKGFEVTLNDGGWIHGKYTWDGVSFGFSLR